MKVLLTGSGGQLGYELQRTCPDRVTLLAVDAAELDITQSAAVERYGQQHAPDVVINAAAYTQVDRAEQEPERAHQVNALGPEYLARMVAQIVGARLIQISTDYVFSGDGCHPYMPDAATSPLGVYGATKLAGEQAVRHLLPTHSVVIRTAWLYSAQGHNFVKTMLKLMRERDQLNVVADQIGSPTWAKGLAQAIWCCIFNSQLNGVMHWTDAGVASWYDFAVAIQEEGLRIGLLSREIPLRPIRTQDYPTPARRPAFSVLDKTATWALLGQTAPHWRVSLRAMMEEMTVANHA